MHWFALQFQTTWTVLYYRKYAWLRWLFRRTLQWRHNELDGVSNHQPDDCLLNRLFKRRSKKTSKFRVTGLCVVTGEFPAQRASNAENVSIWWRHHEFDAFYLAAAPWAHTDLFDTAATDRRFMMTSFHNKDHLSRYGYSHFEDKRVARPSFLYDRNPLTGTTASLYWSGPWTL